MDSLKLLQLLLSALQVSAYLEDNDSFLQPYLIFSTHTGISWIEVDGGYHKVLKGIDGLGVHAVDYHWRLGLLFWSDYEGNALYQAQLDGYNPSTVANITRPSGLAVDWLHNKLYFSHEAGYHNYTIAVWDIQNGMERKHEVILESPAAIWDITCDPLAGFIYWVTGASIQQSYLDGSEVATLKVFKASECANAIAVENRQLFWIDQCDTGHIHVLNLDSPFENTILGQARTRPHYGLTVFNGVLYWTTAGGSIVSNDIITEQQVVGDLGSSHWSGVRTIHSQRQPRAVNSTGTSQSALSSDFLTETSLSIHLTTSLKEADFDTSLIVETDTQIMFEMIPFSTELYTHIESTSSAFYYTATETGSTQGSEMTMVSTSSAGPKSSTVPFDDGQDSESSNPLELVRDHPIASISIGASFSFCFSTLCCLCCALIYKRKYLRKRSRRRRSETIMENARDVWIMENTAASPREEANAAYTTFKSRRNVRETHLDDQTTIVVNKHAVPSAPPPPPIYSSFKHPYNNHSRGSQQQLIPKS